MKASPAPRTRPVLAALVPLLLLAAVLAGAILARLAPRALPGLVLGLAGLGLVGWLLVSTLWPARADRHCPRCGEERLERLSATRTVGVRCSACGYRDETQSAWYLAEEEDEPIAPSGGVRSSVDRHSATD